MPEGGHRPLHLLDLLELLPMPLLRDSLWPHLERADRTSCRTTSRRLRRLAQQMQRSFSIGFNGHRATDEAVRRQGLRMARHEHLQELQLLMSTDERQTVACLRASAAAARRVHTVSVVYGRALTAASGDALALACPALRTLRVDGTTMEPAFFQALHGLEHLEQVRLDEAEDIDPATLGALGTLGALRSLELTSEEGCAVTLDSLPHLGTLSSLHTLCIASGSSLHDADALRSLAALSALTRFTRLSVGVAEDEGRGDRNALCEAGFNAALAQLGTLQSLLSLHFADAAACVDSTGLAGLRRLTALTHLRVERLSGGGGVAPSSASPPTAGCLPHLHDLHLARPMDGAELLAALQPFLPLQHLTHLRVEVCLGGGGVPAAGGGGGNDGRAAPAASVAALRLAVAHLAAAPQLRRVHLTLLGSSASTDAAELGDAMDALQALQSRLGHLALTDLSAAQMSGLTAALTRCPHVHTLHLTSCHLGVATMLHLVQHSDPPLRELHMGYMCTGASAPLLAMALAVAARTRPLTLSWAGLSGKDLEDLREAQGVLGTGQLVKVVAYQWKGHSEWLGVA